MAAEYTLPGVLFPGGDLMNLKQLPYFIAIAEEGSVTRPPTASGSPSLPCPTTWLRPSVSWAYSYFCGMDAASIPPRTASSLSIMPEPSFTQRSRHCGVSRSSGRRHRVRCRVRCRVMRRKLCGLNPALSAFGGHETGSRPKDICPDSP